MEIFTGEIEADLFSQTTRGMNMSGLPPVIEPIMNDYISLVHNQLPEVLEGMYLHGSIALSAYEHGSSDIDFIAVLNRHLTPSELVTLSDIHKNVEKVHVKPELDGVYILPEHIGLCQGKERTYRLFSLTKVNSQLESISTLTRSLGTCFKKRGSLFWEKTFPPIM